MGELVNEFTWSKSRDATFRECLRAYFLSHYGSWGGWQHDAPPETREIYLQKNLSNRSAWLGILVHEVAERALKALRRGILWPLDQALQETEKRMRTELEISRAGAYRSGARAWWNGRRARFGGLSEHYYQEPVPDEDWEETIQTALGCVKTLYASPHFMRLQRLPADAFLSVEDLEAFYIDDIKVWVKLDLAVRAKDGGVVILDWKTGLQHAEKDIALQLGIYGLYGARLWNVAPEQVQGLDINLRDGTPRKHTISHERLEHVEGYIRDSAAQMRARLDDVGQNLASPEQFPMCDALLSCRRCRFRRTCGREQEPPAPLPHEQQADEQEV